MQYKKIVKLQREKRATEKPLRGCYIDLKIWYSIKWIKKNKNYDQINKTKHSMQWTRKKKSFWARVATTINN